MNIFVYGVSNVSLSNLLTFEATSNGFYSTRFIYKFIFSTRKYIQMLNKFHFSYSLRPHTNVMHMQRIFYPNVTTKNSIWRVRDLVIKRQIPLIFRTIRFSTVWIRYNAKIRWARYMISSEPINCFRYNWAAIASSLIDSILYNQWVSSDFIMVAIFSPHLVSSNFPLIFSTMENSIRFIPKSNSHTILCNSSS